MIPQVGYNFNPSGTDCRKSPGWNCQLDCRWDAISMSQLHFLVGLSELSFLCYMFSHLGDLKISQNSQESIYIGVFILTKINFTKKETPTQWFSCEFAKFLRAVFFKECLRCLLLNMIKRLTRAAQQKQTEFHSDDSFHSNVLLFYHEKIGKSLFFKPLFFCFQGEWQ